MGGRGIRGLKSRFGVSTALAEGPVCLSSTMKVYSLEDSEEEITMLSPEEAGRRSSGCSKS